MRYLIFPLALFVVILYSCVVGHPSKSSFDPKGSIPYTTANAMWNHYMTGSGVDRSFNAVIKQSYLFADEIAALFLKGKGKVIRIKFINAAYCDTCTKYDSLKNKLTVLIQLMTKHKNDTTYRYYDLRYFPSESMALYKLPPYCPPPPICKDIEE